MTDAHFRVNGTTEDERVRCAAGCQRKVEMRIGQIRTLRVGAGAAHARLAR
jgi:hypothetical protein